MIDEKIVTGIDIGTTKIVVIIARYTSNEDVKILGKGEHPSKGLDRGIINDIQEAKKSLDEAVKMAENEAEYNIKEAYVGITGDIKGVAGIGKIMIGKNHQKNLEGQSITQDDINEVIKKAKDVILPNNSRILHTNITQYKVDKRDGITNPIGLTGHILEVNAHLVISQKNIEKDLQKCLEAIGVHVIQFVFEPIASACSVLSNDEKDLGIALIDIGGGTTDIIIYHKGGIQYTDTISYGGEIITQDITHGLVTSKTQAEKIKLNYGTAKSALADDTPNIKISGIRGQGSKEVSEKDISLIIEPRLREIFEFVKDKLLTNNLTKKLNFGLVITGGGSQMNNIIDLAQEIFGINVKIGAPHSIEDLNESMNTPKYATAIGLINYAIEEKKLEALPPPSVPWYENIINHIKNGIRKLY